MGEGSRDTTKRITKKEGKEMTLENIIHEISETISNNIVVIEIPETKGILSDTGKIKLETLLTEYANTLRQDILDTVWIEYIK